MISGVIGGIIAVAVWQLVMYFKNKREEKDMLETVTEETPSQDAVAEQPVSDLDIVVNALRRLQCEPEVQKDDDGDIAISFEYQAERFSMRIYSDNKFVMLYDVFWYRFDANDIDQLSAMKKVINEINWQSQVNVCYNKIDDDSAINLHSVTSFICTNEEDMVGYLRHILRECFVVHNNFFKMMAESMAKQ